MRSQGFTLLELLTALTTAAILTFLIIPATSAIVARQRISSSLSNLTNSLKYARTHAVLNQTGVTMLALKNNWGTGWMVFEDPNRNALLDDGERLLLSRKPSDTLVIAGNKPIVNYVHFNMFGEPELSNGGFQAGTMTLCSPEAPGTRYKLVMAKTGRLRMSSSASSAPCLTVIKGS